ncbi:unnamed protein product, partial [Meganyctiphanes norvegica]
MKDSSTLYPSNLVLGLTSRETTGLKKRHDTSPGRAKLEKWLHSSMKIEMTDGRTLVGSFVCTDRDNNIILGSCTEHLRPDEDGREEEARVLGLAMIPGRHIVSICVDEALHSRPNQGALYT